MADINGYFQVIRNKDGIFLRVFAPIEGGKQVQLDEVMKYLEHNQINDYMSKEVKKALQLNEKSEDIFIAKYQGYPINEYMHIHVTTDEMKAYVRFYPPSNDGQRISIQEMKSDLAVYGIKYGINETVLQNQLKNPRYCTDYMIATGKNVVEGKNAYITYMFNTKQIARPKHNEDGSVDFHNLENINHISAGDLLAKLTKADYGIPGINVYGKEIRPAKVKELTLKYGRNIKLSQDELSIYSEVSGHVRFEGNKVFVSNVYEVPADVDNSTGDITYEGNVLVHGNVRTGFKIRATGDVEVMGHMEGGEIISGGQVIIHHGIQGMNKGMIVAKGNVIAKFIESAQVHTEGYLEADAIIQSKVSAIGDIYVNGTKGNIIGGYIRSSTKISAKTIGSPMGITTVVEVGQNPKQQDKMSKLKKEIDEKKCLYKKLKDLCNVFQKKLSEGKLSQELAVQFKKNLETMKILEKEVQNAQEELNHIIEEMNENENAQICANNVIYPGVKVVISDEMQNINEKLSHLRLVKEGGLIKILAY